MLNLQNQIGNEEIMKQLTHLSTNQMLFGNLAYIVLFLALGYLVFKRKMYDDSSKRGCERDVQPYCRLAVS